MEKGKRTKRTLYTLLAIVVSVVVLNQVGSKKLYPSDNIRDQLVRFNEVFAYINKYYVEAPDNEEIVTGAIEGMLSELDPHSVYIPKKRLEKVNEEFEGSFEGIGIEFVVLNKVLTVVAPIVGGPSEAVGILPGDQIIKIEGKSAYGITEDEVQKQLRGPKGSKVKVGIRRPGQDGEFDVTIIRDKIPIYSVTASFMMDDNETGYVYLGRFAKTTSQELEDALNKLEKQGMKRLILDLRGNSGGFLDQAFEVANKFIPGGQKIVYTRGRLKNAGSDFYSTDEGTHALYPLVVMIDHGSASASEIVAGAMQDLDRGLVVGETSFGKGLVQNQIPLRDGSALRLTVARYYTPSGRLIQRPYDNEGIVDYYADAYDDSTKASKIDSTQKFHTLSGRVVYGGGGINPDEHLESEKITRFTFNLRSKRIFFEYGSTFGKKMKKWHDYDQFHKEFKVTDAMLSDLQSLMKKHDIEMNQEAWDKDLGYIKSFMKAEVARNLWDSEHFYMVRITDDHEVQQAVQLFPKAVEIAMLNNWVEKM